MRTMMSAVLLLALLAFAVIHVSPAFSTVSGTTVRVTYSGNGTTTAFSFPHYFLANADLVVILRDSTSLYETTQTITTHYTVTGAGVAAGGTVTFLTAPATGKTVVIYRRNALTQDLNLVDNDAMPAEELEKRFDKLTMQIQYLDFVLGRSVRMTDGNTTTFTTTLPVTLTASRVLKTNSGGTGFELVPSGIDPGDVTTLEILDGTIVNADVSASAAIAYSKLSLTNSVVAADIAAGGVASSEILDDSIVNADVNSAAGIVYSKLAFSNNIVAGDIATSAVASAEILDDTIVNADINSAAAIVYSKLAFSNNIVAGDIATSAVTSAEVLDDTIVNADINSAAAITYSKLAFSNNIVAGDIATSAVATAEILDGTIVSADLSTTANVTYGQLAFSNNIVAGDIATSAVASAEILDDTIVNADVNSAAGIVYSKLAFSNNIVAGDIATSAVATAEILNATILAEDMADDAITFAKFQNLSGPDLLIGRDTAGAGDATEITLGAGLVMTAGVLDVTGAGALITLKDGATSLGTIGTLILSGDEFIGTVGGTSGSIQIATDGVTSRALGANSVDTSEIVGGAPGAAGAEFADSVTNITAATDLTLNATGDEVTVPADKYLKLLGSATDPANNGAIGFNTTRETHTFKSDVGVLGLVGVLHTQIAEAGGDTVASTDAETDYASNVSIPANSLSAGKVIRFRAWGRYSTTGTPTLRHRFKLGATTIIDTLAVTTDNNASNRGWSLHGPLIVRSIGATGTVIGAADTALQYNAGAFGSLRSGIDTATPTVTVDTTGALTAQVSADWSVLSASNTVTLEGFIVEIGR